MNGNIRIGNLFGIPFFINPSWFFVLGLITLSYGTNLTQFPELTGILPWLLGLVAALLLFTSVLAHELGHSFVAIAQGIPVKSITLFIFGGLATLEKESETPLQAFLVAIAGPLVSIILFGVFAFIGAIAPLNAPLEAIVQLLASINLILALFNLIPGLPLDGGNVLKSIVWQITGNPNKGVIFAGRVGQIIGWLGIIIGGLAVLGISPVGSLWTLLIGWFLLRNAGFAAQSATVQDKLDNYTAKDAIVPDSPIVVESLSIREFVNDYVIGKERWKKFLVTDEEGILIGAIATEDLKAIPTSQWNETHLRELTQPLETVKTIPAEMSLLEVVKKIEIENLGELAVVTPSGGVMGLLEKSSIINLMEKEAEGKKPVEEAIENTEGSDKTYIN